KSAGKGGSRARNQHPLHEALHQVLKGKTMGIPEMIDAVKKTGFKSSSANFKTMVAIALGKHKNLFKRVARGQYTAK
ncbi:MAG TPA: hypothetical protein VG711_04860, partial [Phycisphaerales bacterium]|nr:hypothetical protein [Phycisphaerales bacterium]